MKHHQHLWYVLVLLSVMLIGSGTMVGCSQKTDPTQSSQSGVQAQDESSSRDPDVPYVPTPQNVVDRMLELANVSEDDIVYDLGSGDGRIVITAAQTYGARGVGIEIDSQRVQEARKNAEEAGVADLVEFRQGDLFEADISEATVVTLYLLPSVNLKLRPKLFDELAPGTPVVSHDFDMDGWKPEQTVEMGSDTIFLWTIPEEVPEHLRE